MVLPVIVIPLWGKLLALSVAKKITVLLAARYYGFPRIYRKSLHSVRWLIKDPRRREWYTSYVRAVWRIPDRILYRWHNKAVKAAGVRTSLPHSPLAAQIRTAVSVDRLFPDTPALAAHTHPSGLAKAKAASQLPGTSFASAPVLREHHSELQQHRKQLRKAASLDSAYERLRKFGRQGLRSVRGNVRHRLQNVAISARSRQLND